MQLRFATMALGALLAVHGSGLAAARPAARPVASIALPTAPWSIAGIRLGMRPQEVADAMKAAGYVLGYRDTGRSWQGEVTNQISTLRGIRVPAGAEVVRNEDYKKGQEGIQVTYGVSPAGPYVAGVIYRIHAAAIDAERFRAAALSRYGRPSLKWDFESLYCSAGERECARTGSLITNQQPNLTVYIADGMKRSLELRQGQAADRALQAAIKSEAERLYPKKDKPSF